MKPLTSLLVVSLSVALALTAGAHGAGPGPGGVEEHRCARLGINCIRFHLLDSPAPTTNTGQVWKDNRRTAIETWGGAPGCTKPVRGQVTLRGLSGATILTGTALNADDQPAGEIAIRRLRADSDEWNLDLNDPGAAPAISWIIEVTR